MNWFRTWLTRFRTYQLHHFPRLTLRAGLKVWCNTTYIPGYREPGIVTSVGRVKYGYSIAVKCYRDTALGTTEVLRVFGPQQIEWRVE